MKKTATNAKDHGKKGGSPLLLSVALGAALAAGAGYYVTHKEEIDREAKKRYSELAKQFNQTRVEVEKRVREVWGEVSHEAIATYMDARGLLLNILEDENVQMAGKLVQQNYDKAVERAVKEAKRHGLLDGSAEKKLKALLKQDWKKVQQVFQSSVKMMGKAVKKGQSKGKKLAKKTMGAAKGAAKKSGVKKMVQKSAKKSPAKKAAGKSKKAGAGSRKK